MNISNCENMLDGREVVARLEELEGEKADLTTDLEAASAAERTQAASDLASWMEDNEEELDALSAFVDYNRELWRHGETLIREDYFEDYAQELAEDIGAIGKDMPWPCTCIDWEQAAQELKQDYTESEFDGTTYYWRG